MTVQLISEENHGIIGIAKNYTCAIEWLIESNWINSGTECYGFDDNCTYMTLEERFGNNWKAELFTLTQDQFQDLFEGQFMIMKLNVIGT